MSSHDYAECQDQACDLCDAHDEGYSDGKAEALFECAIAACHMAATPECRCSPCTALRYAIHSMSQGEPGPAPPAPKMGRCVGCGREGMAIQIGVNQIGPTLICQQCWV